MSRAEFTVHDLMDLLVEKVGLPAGERTDRLDIAFPMLGLDSLAFLQLQSELSQRYGVELPDDDANACRVGDIVTAVRAA